MYLVPYLLAAVMYAGALTISLRSCASFSAKSLQGKTARAVTSALLLVLLVIIWKYVTVETFEAKKWSDESLVAWVRGISLLLFAGANFEVWAGIKVKENK